MLIADVAQLERCSTLPFLSRTKTALPHRRPRTAQEVRTAPYASASFLDKSIREGQRAAIERVGDQGKESESVVVPSSSMRKIERKAAQIAKKRKRAEIYALNALMRSQYEASQQW